MRFLVLCLLIICTGCQGNNTSSASASQSVQEHAWPEALGPYKQWEGVYTVILDGFDLKQSVQIQGFENGFLVVGNRFTPSMSYSTSQPKEWEIMQFPVVEYDPKTLKGKMHISSYNLNLGILETVDFELAEKNGKKSLIIRDQEGKTVNYTLEKTTITDHQNKFPKWDEVNKIGKWFGNYIADSESGHNHLKVEVNIGQNNFAGLNEKADVVLVSQILSRDGLPYVNMYSQEQNQPQKAQGFVLNEETMSMDVKGMQVVAHGHEGDLFPVMADVKLKLVNTEGRQPVIQAKYSAQTPNGIMNYDLNFFPNKQ